MFKNTISFGFLGAFVYLVMLYILNMGNMAMSSAPDWLFRILLLVVIMLSIRHQRQINKRNLNFKQGLLTGLLCTLFLSLGMFGTTYLFRSQIAPNYETEAKNIYKENRRFQMYNIRLVKANEEDRDKLNAQDSIAVEQGLEKHIEITAYYFTPTGGAIATAAYTLLWGLFISLTGAYLFRNYEPKNQPKVQVLKQRSI